MCRHPFLLLFTIACCTSIVYPQQSAIPLIPQPDPATLRANWLDPDTGHRIIRLSTENDSANLYFHDIAYSPDGTKFIFNSPAGIMAADLVSQKSNLIVPGTRAMSVARFSNEVYYISNGAMMAADLTTKVTRQIVAVPGNLQVTCVNCDGTLFGGIISNASDPIGHATKPTQLPKADQIDRMFPGKRESELTPEQLASAQKETRLAATLVSILNTSNPRCLFTLNARTGEVKQFNYEYAWLNHLQFSPTDPNLLMFCHEGPWHEIDRVWTIKVNDEKPVAKSMHQRTMDMEIWGHEWWAPDGQSVWFDLQTPRSVDFCIAGVNLATGKETRYHIDRNWWGIHYAMSKDGKLFASEGGDPTQVAFAPDGQWINLLTPQPDGTIVREKLVNMKRHTYVTAASGGISGVEPNLTFSPDGKYILFNGNFDGARHVYAVEVAKSK